MNKYLLYPGCSMESSGKAYGESINTILEPLDLRLDDELQTDERFTGKIKWYIAPIVFGGSPKMDENGTWIDLATHCQAVAFWNRTYWEAKRENGGAVDPAIT